jgi:uncharacterized protein YPO0396
MSIALNSTGQVEPITYTPLTTTNATAILTVNAHYQQRIEAIVLANVDVGNTCYVTLSWNDGSSDFVFWTGTVATGSTTVIDNIKIVMRTDGKVRVIKATAAAANDINVTVITSAISRQNAG